MRQMRLPVQALNPRQTGFTLMEVLVSLTIIALLMSLTVPYLYRAPDGPRLETSARLIAGMLRLSRAEAITGNRETVVNIDVPGRTISLAGHNPINLSSDIVIHLVVARQERHASALASMRFFPDGSSSGGDITLSLHDREARISVNWLDGNVRLDLSKPPLANAEHMP